MSWLWLCGYDIIALRCLCRCHYLCLYLFFFAFVFGLVPCNIRPFALALCCELRCGAVRRRDACALNRFASKLKHFKIYTHNCQKVLEFVYQRTAFPPPPYPLAKTTLPLAMQAAPPPPSWLRHCIRNRKALPAFNLELCTKRAQNIYDSLSLSPSLSVYLSLSMCVAVSLAVSVVRVRDFWSVH